MYNYHLQQQILSEVHSRPFQDLPAPLSLVHIAVLYDGADPEECEDIVFSLLRKMGFEVAAVHKGFLFSKLQNLAVRYEPHNEFYSLTLYSFVSLDPLPLPPTWKTDLPGALLCGVEVLFRDQTSTLNDWALTHFGSFQQTSSTVMSDAATIVTDFQLQPSSGFVRVLVEDHNLRPAQAGRLLQRICEIETYRHLALISLPLVKELLPKVTELDDRLAAISQRSLSDDVSNLLAQMLELSAEVEALSACSANRFSASEAYFALVDRSIRELREARVEGKQMFQEFMDRRLHPARRSSQSVSSRIDMLSKRILRTTEVLQSQVSLAIEKQNKELLEALNKRSKTQLSLQAKLEGLSVVVVAYYFYDLVDKALKNTIPKGELLDTLLVYLTAFLPFGIVILYVVVRRLLSRVVGKS